IVTRNGQVRSDTFWATRVNNYTDLAALVVANTITGAASLFRASLVPQILPFPKPIGHAYHDHWIALAALVKGKIGYVEQPLYDYVQHSVNDVGHKYAGVPGLVRVAQQLAGAASDRNSFRCLVRDMLKRAVRNYELVAQKYFLARSLLVRF